MFILSKFGERLKELMEERDINAPALAEILHTDRTNITRYRNGERAPQYDLFIAMLEYFECSADYLLGLIDIPPEIASFKKAKPFNERFRFILTYCKVSQYKLTNEYNFSGSKIHNWLTGLKLPSIASLCKLSEDLELTVDFILGRID